MKKTITERLSALRLLMTDQGIDACIIPSSDPHQSEYVANRWKYREYMSGFSGSMGVLVIGREHAGLWVDSRYFLQAEMQLEGSGIQMFKSSLPETPTPEQWIVSQKYKTIGLDGSVFSMKETQAMISFFQANGCCLNPAFESYSATWPDRPAFPENEIYCFPVKYSGESAASKMERLRAEILEKGAEGMPLSCLDEVAWLFNIRGNDIEFNPLGVAHAYIDQHAAWLFTQPSKISAATAGQLQSDGIQVLPYDELPAFLSKQAGTPLLIDKSRLSHAVCSSIPAGNIQIEAPSPVARMKAIKNETEIAGFKRAMIKDGVALTRFLMELEKQMAEGKQDVTEWSIACRIAEFRKQQGDCVCDSFAPIISYKDHGAIVHYSVTPESAYPVLPNGILLADTGGQYFDGTTDITRTFSLYDETPELYKEDYTSLLKGVIALSAAVFPTATRGVQLDVLARQYIWKRNVNYLHGTGHGVGHFLNVHEGPHSVRMNENPVVLEAGMTLTNEPAIYRTGQWGVRVENVMLIKEENTSEFGQYLCFEVLTLFPLDPKSIKVSMLSAEEKCWINDYHERVYNTLAPFLSEEEKAWMKTKTQKI